MTAFLPYTVSKFNQPTDSRKPLLSLSISVYKKTDFFRLILASLKTQTLKNFEIIVCDDGSDAVASAEFQKQLLDSGFPSTYLWHEDKGFCKNEILNKGINEARADVMVFIDGDCILHPRFLEDHYELQEEGKILAGRRVNLTNFVSRQLTAEKIENQFLQKNLYWILPVISWEKDNNAHRGVRVESESIFALFNRKPRGIVGSNFSVARKELIKVNGFDMRYHAPGTGEDSDIEWRLQRAGLQTKPILQRAIQYHIWHRLQARNPETEAHFATVMAKGEARTEVGLEQLQGTVRKMAN